MEEFLNLCPIDKPVSTLEDIQLLSVAELKKILRNYKENLSGKKADLQLKVFSLFCKISNETSQSNLLLESTSTSDHTTCVTYNHIHDRELKNVIWSSDLRQMPELSFIQLYDYLVVITEKYTNSVLKRISYKKLKAFNFFYEGFIKSLEVANSVEFVYMHAKVKASMKSSLYKVIIKFSYKTNDIIAAACTCPAGSSPLCLGKCNHIGAVLFLMEDFNRKEMKQFPDTITCTSKLSKWNVPRDSSSKPLPINDITVRKIKFGDKTEKVVKPKTADYDPRATTQREVNNNDIDKLRQQLFEAFPSSSFFLYNDPPSSFQEHGEPQQIECEEVEFTEDMDYEEEADINTLPFNEFYDISALKFTELVNHYVDSKVISTKQIKHIEKETRGQSSSELWWSIRKEILTASNFYNAAVTKVEPSSKIKSMLYSNVKTTGMMHGVQNEKRALDSYVTHLHNSGLAVFIGQPGIIISKTHPYLGASLDACVTDINTNTEWGVEIKCPSSKVGLGIEAVLQDRKFYLHRESNGTIKLKNSHPYFYQIQGQLFCSQLDRVDFVVWFGDNVPLYVETIKFDPVFWEKVLPRLDYFYRKAFVPELFTRRVERGEKLYQHGGWKCLKSKDS